MTSAGLGAEPQVVSYYKDSLSYLQIYVSGSLTPPSTIGQAFSFESSTTPFQTNSFFATSCSTCQVQEDYLDVTSISSPGIVNFTSGAPEPSIWALIIAGVGMIGAVLRVDRRREARAAA